MYCRIDKAAVAAANGEPPVEPEADIDIEDMLLIIDGELSGLCVLKVNKLLTTDAVDVHTQILNRKATITGERLASKGMVNVPPGIPEEEVDDEDDDDDDEDYEVEDDDEDDEEDDDLEEENDNGEDEDDEDNEDEVDEDDELELEGGRELIEEATEDVEVVWGDGVAVTRTSAVASVVNGLLEVDVSEVRSRVLSRSQLVFILSAVSARLKLQPQPKHNGRVCVGLIGYPNVGKSSVINTILQVSKSTHGTSSTSFYHHLMTWLTPALH
jgi:hypothetical protein